MRSKELEVKNYDMLAKLMQVRDERYEAEMQVLEKEEELNDLKQECEALMREIYMLERQAVQVRIDRYYIL